MSREKITSFLEKFPTFNPIIAIVIFIVIPITPAIVIIIRRCFYKTTAHECLKDIKNDIFNYLVKYSGVYALINFLLVLVLCLHQVAYCYQSNFSVGYNVDYYLRVNSVEFNSYEAVSYAQTNSQLGAIKYSNNHRRHLASSGTITIIYHTQNYDNLISSSNDYQLLLDVCNTENAIRNLPCIQVGNSYYSILQQLFTDPSICTLESLKPSSDLTAVYSNPDNSYFLQSNIGSSSNSAIILSYFNSGSCTSETYQSFQNQLYNSVIGPVEVIYVNNSFLTQEFLDGIYNVIYVTIISIIASAIVLLFGLRGFICTIVTLFCIAMSMIAALGILPAAQYSAFSAFNVLSVYILVGVGATTVLIWGTAWRTIFHTKTKANNSNHSLYKNVTAYLYTYYINPEITAEINGTNVGHVYSIIGPPAFFTALATYLSLFSKLASPVIVVSQLGLYMGTSYIIFYPLFHYIIIPSWILTSKFNLCYKKSHTTSTIYGRMDLTTPPPSPNIRYRLTENNAPEDQLMYNNHESNYEPYNTQINQSYNNTTNNNHVTRNHHSINTNTNMYTTTNIYDDNNNHSHNFDYSIPSVEAVVHPASTYHVPMTYVINTPPPITSMDTNFNIHDDKSEEVVNQYNNQDVLVYNNNTNNNNNGSNYNNKFNDDSNNNTNNNNNNNNINHNNEITDDLFSKRNSKNKMIPRLSILNNNQISTRTSSAAITSQSVTTAATNISATHSNNNNNNNNNNVINSDNNTYINRLLKIPYSTRYIGVFALLLVISINCIVYFVGIAPKVVLDFGIPQLYATTTNLGQVVYVIKKYRADIFTVGTPTNGVSSIGLSTTNTPTLVPIPFVSYKPTVIPSKSHKPTRVPSSSPTRIPTFNPSYKPTFSPSKLPFIYSYSPSISQEPTNKPSVIPTVTTTANNIIGSTNTHTDYIVQGCYGIGQSRQYIDAPGMY